jgi:hypothetical protein
MLRTIEATIDSQGRVSLAENVKLASPKRALVTILEDDPNFHFTEIAELSKSVFAEDRSLSNQAQLQNEPFIGMWQDREDMQDSSEWIKNLRGREWNLKLCK